MPVQGLHAAGVRGLPAPLGRVVHRPRRGSADGSPRRCRAVAGRRRRLRAVPSLGRGAIRRPSPALIGWPTSRKLFRTDPCARIPRPEGAPGPAAPRGAHGAGGRRPPDRRLRPRADPSRDRRPRRHDGTASGRDGWAHRRAPDQRPRLQRRWPSSAKATSPPACPYRCRPSPPSTLPSPTTPASHCCTPAPAPPSTAARNTATSGPPHGPPASPDQSVPMRCAARSAPSGSTRTSRCATSSTYSATARPETTVAGYDLNGDALERTRLPPGRWLPRWWAD